MANKRCGVNIVNFPIVWTRWLAFVAGLIAIWFFVFGLAPFIQRFAPVNTVHEYIEQRDIDATTLFYTETDEFAEAELYLQNAMSYSKKL